MNDEQWGEYKERAKKKLLKYLEDTRKPLPENPDHGCFVVTTYFYSNRLDSVVEDSSMFCRDCGGDRGLADALSEIRDECEPLAHTFHPINRYEALIDAAYGFDRAIRVEYREDGP